ncbi:MAG: DUF2275 domain-containing protein [Geobacteraceae bacterium]|nr:DUF2275 domain-containing protein [Geobacteraceae bacterium]
MDHDSIRHKLSEYLDGAVIPAEKLLIEKHLAECSDCRKSLCELEKTVQHLRNLGELEPPPWLAVRIMARVREEADREKGLLLRLLHMPLRWRVSVEAVALVFLSVTGYLVYRNVSSELPQITPLSGVTREESAPVVPPVAKSQKLPEEEKAPAVRKPPAVMAEKPGVGSVPLGLPEEEPFAEPRQEELEPPAPSPAEAPFRAENKGMPDFRMQERSAAKSLSPSDDFSLPEKKSEAPSGLVRNKALPSSGVETLRLELLVADAYSVQREVERATVRFGGIILRRDFNLGGEGVLVVRLQREAVQGYIKLLKKLGDVRGGVSAAPEGDDTVEIYLAVTTRRE